MIQLLKNIPISDFDRIKLKDLLKLPRVWNGNKAHGGWFITPPSWYKGRVLKTKCNYAYLTRVIASLILGRNLRKGEIIVFLNRDRNDVRINNLFLGTRKDSGGWAHLRVGPNRVCHRCKRRYRVSPSRHTKFCSAKCRTKADAIRTSRRGAVFYKLKFQPYKKRFTKVIS